MEGGAGSRRPPLEIESCSRTAMSHDTSSTRAVHEAEHSDVKHPGRVGPCRRCSESVPVGTTTGPECGYDVAEHNRPRLPCGSIGVVLSLSVILSPVGLPLLWLAHGHLRRAQGDVTTGASISIYEHVIRSSDTISNSIRSRFGKRNSLEAGRIPSGIQTDPRISTVGDNRHVRRTITPDFIHVHVLRTW